jgi:hypothetical protein
MPREVLEIVDVRCDMWDVTFRIAECGLRIEKQGARRQESESRIEVSDSVSVFSDT